jgi:hypothetical protein
MVFAGHGERARAETQTFFGHVRRDAGQRDESAASMSGDLDLI